MIESFALVFEDSRVKPEEATLMAIGLEKFMAEKVCPQWSWTPLPVKLYPNETSVPTCNTVALCVVVPNVAGAPSGALGWHTEEGGRRKLYIECDPIYSNGGVTLYDPTNPQTMTLLSVIAHEFFETRGDETVNIWVDDPSGQTPNLETALELCDACEDGIVPFDVKDPSDPTGEKVVTLGMSNFLYEGWFDPQTPAGTKVDELGACPGPGRLSKTGGGYKINRTLLDGSEQQQTGQSHVVTKEFGATFPEWKKAWRGNGKYRGAIRVAGASTPVAAPAV